MLENDITEYDFKAHLIPITNRSGFHVDFPDLPQTIPLVTLKDYQDYVGDVETFGRYTDEHIELMREGIKKGMVLPAVVLEGYEDAIQPQMVSDATKSLLFAPFLILPERFTQSDREDLTSRAAQAISESVVPGYQRLSKIFAERVRP